jgi:hypothetical protein
VCNRISWEGGEVGGLPHCITGPGQIFRAGERERVQNDIHVGT